MTKPISRGILSSMLKLAIEARKTGREELKGDKIPAVFYGRKEESTSIAVALKDFKKVLKEAGESTVIALTGVGEEKEALIHDVDFEPVTGQPRHADFYIIEKGKKVQVTVPLNFVGIAPAVKELGGVLMKILYEVEVEALPKDLPHEINVDISSLADFESKIEIKNITLPEGVMILGDADEVVALVSEVKEEVIEEAPAALDLSTIEVEKRGKEEVPEESAEGEEKGE